MVVRKFRRRRKKVISIPFLFLTIILSIFTLFIFRHIKILPLPDFKKRNEIRLIIYNACSKYCNYIKLEGLGKELAKRFTEGNFMILEIKNHPQFKIKINSEIRYSSNNLDKAKELHKLIPFAEMLETKTYTDTIQILLGMDSIKELFNKGIENENEIVIIIKEEFFNQLEPIILNTFKEFKKVIFKGDGNSYEMQAHIELYYPSNLKDRVESVRLKLSNQEYIEKVNDNLNNIIVVIPMWEGEKKAEDYWIIVKKSDFKLYLYKGTKLVKAYPIALGKNPGDKQRVGDYRTPEGNFYIKEIINSSSWEHDFPDDGKGPIKGAYGPWFLGLYTGPETTKSGKGWEGIGIHGTHDPSSIGTLASEGCIRMYNQDIIELKNLVKIGTPVIIEP
ncbi:MAG: L,D-transpeptidase [Dictyoglomaceae bacterium]|nr:L,D-transpeptidase [Dictyoglomaceae bacterium]